MVLPFLFNILLSLVDGIIFSAAFPDLSLYILAPITLAVLYFILKKSSIWKSAIYGFCFGLGFFLVSLSFINYALNPLGTALVSIMESLFFASFGACWSISKRFFIVRKNPFINAIAFAALYTAFEQLRGILPLGGFPWGSVAYSQSASPIGKLSYFIGQSGVVIVIVFFSVYLYRLFSFIITLRPIKTISCAVLLVIIYFSGNIFYAFDNLQNENDQNKNSFTFAAVQGNIKYHPSGDTSEADTLAFENHITETEKMLETAEYKSKQAQIQAVFWPESSIEFDPLNSANQKDLSRLYKLVDRVGKPFIIGGPTFKSENGVKKKFNSVFVIAPEKGIVGQYDKQHILPFGEFIPARDFFAFLDKQHTDLITDIYPGKNDNVIKLDNANIGVRICFEVADSQLIDKSVKNSANIFFFPSNDSNFGPSSESAQQLQIAQFRSIENKRSTIELSTNGISATIDPLGEIANKTSLYTNAHFIAALPLNNTIPPHLEIEPWIVGVCYILSGGLFILGTIFSFAKKKK
ncbi:MAG: apolipoprotein N-acyltransferase [Bifidobacteriaceae bacterium]|jgi:apolipoprotein N-acyltransferase|nr:apolipoprotein N-acyltransferase [Bifidobacteriaceae bacterium]